MKRQLGAALTWTEGNCKGLVLANFDNQLVTFWHGKSLGFIEKLCLTSMLAQGYKVTLYSYNHLDDVPAGIVLGDAADIMPIEQMHINSATSSPALGSNIFRYKMLQLGLGCWVDTDILLLKKIETNGDFVFGYQNSQIINNAILYAPKDSRLVEDLLQYVQTRPVIPPWWPRRKKLSQRARHVVGLARPPEMLAWGIFGLQALTHFVKKNRLEKHAQKIHVFYPVHYLDADAPFDAEADLNDYIRSDTIAIHLWNNNLKTLKTQRPPEGSYIWHKCREYGVKID